MNRRWMRGVGLVGLALALGVAWWLQNRSNPGPGAQGQAAGPGPAAAAPRGPGSGPGGTPAVEVAQVQTLRLQDDAQAVGTLRSRQSVMLRPEVGGRIARLAFQEGARVRRGQLLVQLDDTLQQAELSQAQAQLSIAQANLRRNQELVAANFVAQRVVDEGAAAVQVAQAQVALAQARLERMRVVAPFDGTVGLRQVDLGAYVKDGADLVNLEDTSSLLVDFRLPERYQARLAPGQAVRVQFDALPGKAYEARVLAVDPLVEANGRALAVRAALPTTATELRPGMFARVTVIFSVDEAALVVPEEAVVPQAGRPVVVRLDAEGDGEARRMVSRRVEVTLGARVGAQVQVTSGLQAGDTVVVAGQQRLQRDGTAVRVVDLSRPSGGPKAPGGPAASPAATTADRPAAAPARP